MQTFSAANIYRNLNLLLVLFACFVSINAKADHYFGGYFYYDHVGDKELQVTLVTYTDFDKVKSDRDSVKFYWGDGSTSFLVRINNAGEGEEIYPGMKKNIYVGRHEYNRFANFQSYFSDNFRLFDVNNFGVGKSGVTNLRFDGVAPMQDSTIYCTNNSPKPQLDPYFYGKTGQQIELNFGYFDADGDSMSFELTPCKGGSGDAAEGYVIPNGATINPETGHFIWTSPTQGKYSFSFLVNEYRNGQKIGVSSSDFTLFISRPEFPANPTGTKSTISGATNGKYNFSGAETKTFSLEYTHPDADSIKCTVYSGLKNSSGFSFIEKQAKTNTNIKDTISLTYDGIEKLNGVNTIVWECIAYLGVDSIVKQHIPLGITVDNKLSWSCLSPDLEDIEELTPEIPSLTVSPNLFNDHVWINVGSNFESVDVLIFDLRGRLVRSYFNLKNATVKLDLANLSMAMYVLQVYNNDELLHTGKIMKQ